MRGNGLRGEFGVRESLNVRRRGLEGVKERSTSLTLDQQISHLPRGPRSSLMKRSNATPSSESNEETGEIFAPN